ncbi:uncharacterized protein LOC123508516 [Portunus trituberculatus]|uniref:uncharacterized protein LOC123508516 n=1 Tax=Portunus trituberculatus TaxID=210409 RepID=UPI001E1CD615|nr:uncharacterized protein LOC123508516 [Portunus trituberculatus]
MREFLWRWVWLLWVCLAAVAAAVSGKGQCEVLDLSLEPAVYPLPTNLTLRPGVSGWQLNFTLLDGQAAPVACVRLKEVGIKVQVMLYDKDCVTNKLIQYHYLERSQVPPHNWTSLALHVKNKTVVITPPNGYTVTLNANTSPVHHALQVSLAQNVEVAVGCRISCPLHTHASQGVRKKVQEWRRGKLHFSFLPGPSFDNLHYEVNCTTQHKPFSQKVDIKPGPGWNQVQLEQQDTRAEVFLNNRLLEELLLPDTCIDTIHVIWMVGDASFGFKCVPEALHLLGADATATPAPPSISTGAAVGITIGTLLLVEVLGCVFIVLVIYCYLKSRTRPTPHSGDQVTYTSVDQSEPVRNGRVTPPDTQPSQAPMSPGVSPSENDPPPAIRLAQDTQAFQNKGAPPSEEDPPIFTQAGVSDTLHTPISHSQAPQTNTHSTDTDAHHDSLSQTEDASQTLKRTAASQPSTRTIGTNTNNIQSRSEKASQTAPHIYPWNSDPESYKAS